MPPGRGRDDREEAVLHGGRMIVDHREHLPLGAEHRDKRVEAVAAEPEALDLDGEPSALLELDREAVLVLARHDAVHGDAGTVEGDRLCLGGRVVGLLLVDHRQDADVEGAKLRDARSRADLHELLARRALGRHVHDDLERLVVDRLDRCDDEALRAADIGQQKHFLGALEPRALEDELAVAAPLDTPGQDERKLRKRGGRRAGRQGQEARRHKGGPAGGVTAGGHGGAPGKCGGGHVRRSVPTAPGRHRRSRSAGRPEP